MTDPGRIELQAAGGHDFESLLALRLRAMRPSLQRLGRYDEQRARERLTAGFDPDYTQHIVQDGRRLGFVVLKPLSHALRLEHLYVEPGAQGLGIGGQVLGWVCAQADRMQLPVEVCVLKHSDALRLYQRHGFVITGDGPWDLDLLRMPLSTGVQTVRAMWQAFQARDWPRARSLLRADLQATWWTSGERFSSADGFIQAQSRYPEGWTIHLIEVAPLQDGRVVSVARVDHPPGQFFATSFFRIDDGIILGIDEYWGTVEAPPDWRIGAALPGWQRVAPDDDPRARVP